MFDYFPADIQLAPGVYDYNFQCNLPSQLPTSVEGGYGFIAYTARVVVDIPLWPDMKFEQPFHVIRPLDVNADPSLQVVYIPRLCESDEMMNFDFDFSFRSLLKKITCSFWAEFFAVVYRNQLE